MWFGVDPRTHIKKTRLKDLGYMLKIRKLFILSSIANIIGGRTYMTI